MRLVTGAVTLLVVVMSLAACGGSDSSSGDGGDGGTVSAGRECSSDQKDALKEIAKGYEAQGGTAPNLVPGEMRVARAECAWSIGVVVPHFKDPYWLANAYGIQQAAERLGVEVKILAGTGYGNVSQQLQQLDTFKAQGVDGLILGAVDGKALAPAVDQAWQAGIPTTYDEVVAESELSLGSFTNDEQVGTAQADYIASKDPQAKVIAFCGPPGALFGKVRCDSFRARLLERAPDAEVLTEKYHPMDRAQIAQVAGNTLQGFPEATWIFNSTDLQAKGVVDALKAAQKKPGDIKVTNATIGRELFDLMKDGWVTYALAERGVSQGELTLERLVHVMNGETAPDAWFSELPGYESTPASIREFEAKETELNWEPEGFQP